MLSLVRTLKEGKNEIVIGRDVHIKIKHVYDNNGRALDLAKVVVCVEAPQGVEILRGELLDEKHVQEQSQSQTRRVDNRDRNRRSGDVRIYKRK